MDFKKFSIGYCFVFILLCFQSLSAAVRLPEIFSDNMVLQRDVPVKVWGWADVGESVTVTFNGQKLSSKTGKEGRWNVTLKPMTHGGPHELKVEGRGAAKVLSNILIGDVWICSGQSNMGWKLSNTNNAEAEISKANYSKIRLFTVQQTVASAPKEEVDGGPWKVCNPESVEDFSAVAYFFGKDIHQELDIPIGLVHTSWGGTNIEAWTRFEDLLQFKAYEKFKNIKPEKISQSPEERDQSWKRYKDALQNDKGLIEKWYEPSTDTSDWKRMELPLEFGKSELGEANGIFWFSRDVEVPADFIGQDALLSLGTIDDKDSTFVNGQLVGSTDVWNIDRMYELPKGVLKTGKNRITIKVTDNASLGGIRGEPSTLYLKAKGHKIPLTGVWKYKASANSLEFGIQNLNPNAYPSQLYNAMLAPLFNFSIKGAIWYQGESNASNGYRYGDLFPTMIRGWREKWGKDFPFIWVQLTNYMKPVEQPAESEWADLREAQSKTLALPNTAQAVIIDLGEAGDIHPRNKKDVGHRLALAALKTAYDKDIVHSGPVFDSMNIDGNKAILSFKSTGSGLKVKDKYGYLKGFAIAGQDRQFVWAKAHVEGDKVVVYSDEVEHPVAVRYAWANNPEDANLYNVEELPASPFRTDTWKTITQKE